jgi:hypothetical protein
METKQKEKQSSGPKKEGLPFKEIPTRNISAEGWKLQCTVKGPNCNQ